MRIRELRIKSGITQNELAKIINVSNQTILNWENEIYEPKIRQLIALADYFKVSVDYLIEHQPNTDELDTIMTQIKSISGDRFVEFIKSEISNKIKN